MRLTIKKLMVVGGIIGLLIGNSGCKKKGEPGEADVELQKLTAIWKMNEVTKDNLPQDGYANFELTLTGSPNTDTYFYTVENRPGLSPWPAGGIWSFGTDKTKQIVRDPDTRDELLMAYKVTDTTLEVTFSYSGSGFAGRTQNTEGEWVFSFSK